MSTTDILRQLLLTECDLPSPPTDSPNVDASERRILFPPHINPPEISLFRDETSIATTTSTSTDVKCKSSIYADAAAAAAAPINPRKIKQCPFCLKTGKDNTIWQHIQKHHTNISLDVRKERWKRDQCLKSKYIAARKTCQNCGVSVTNLKRHVCKTIVRSSAISQHPLASDTIPFEVVDLSIQPPPTSSSVSNRTTQSTACQTEDVIIFTHVEFKKLLALSNTTLPSPSSYPPQPHCSIQQPSDDASPPPLILHHHHHHTPNSTITPPPPSSEKQTTSSSFNSTTSPPTPCLPHHHHTPNSPVLFNTKAPLSSSPDMEYDAISTPIIPKSKLPQRRAPLKRKAKMVITPSVYKTKAARRQHLGCQLITTTKTNKRNVQNVSNSMMTMRPISNSVDENTEDDKVQAVPMVVSSIISDNSHSDDHHDMSSPPPVNNVINRISISDNVDEDGDHNKEFVLIDRQLDIICELYEFNIEGRNLKANNPDDRKKVQNFRNIIRRLLKEIYSKAAASTSPIKCNGKLVTSYSLSIFLSHIDSVIKTVLDTSKFSTNTISTRCSHILHVLKAFEFIREYVNNATTSVEFVDCFHERISQDLSFLLVTVSSSSSVISSSSSSLSINTTNMDADKIIASNIKRLCRLKRNTKKEIRINEKKDKRKKAALTLNKDDVKNFLHNPIVEEYHSALAVKDCEFFNKDKLLAKNHAIMRNILLCDCFIEVPLRLTPFHNMQVHHLNSAVKLAIGYHVDLSDISHKVIASHGDLELIFSVELFKLLVNYVEIFNLSKSLNNYIFGKLNGDQFKSTSALSNLVSSSTIKYMKRSIKATGFRRLALSLVTVRPEMARLLSDYLQTSTDTSERNYRVLAQINQKDETAAAIREVVYSKDSNLTSLFATNNTNVTASSSK